jgi:hypothetical protein
MGKAADVEALWRDGARAFPEMRTALRFVRRR